MNGGEKGPGQDPNLQKLDALRNLNPEKAARLLKVLEALKILAEPEDAKSIGGLKVSLQKALELLNSEELKSFSWLTPEQAIEALKQGLEARKS